MSFLKEFIKFLMIRKNIGYFLILVLVIFGGLIILSQGSTAPFIYTILVKSILGISAFYHDSAACILIDGEIIAVAQEERFTRKKHDSSYPHNAVEFVLNYAKLKLHQIDQIVFFEKPLKFERLLETYVAFAPKGFLSLVKQCHYGLKKSYSKKIYYLIILKNMMKIIILIKIFFSIII